MMQQQQQQQQQQQGQQRPVPASGQAFLKLMLLVNDLGRFDSSRDPNRLEHWEGFVDKHFAENGSFAHHLCGSTDGRTKMFEILRESLPRYFFTQFSSEVENLQITLDGAIEKIVGAEWKVTCDRAKFIYTYKNQCQVSSSISPCERR